MNPYLVVQCEFIAMVLIRRYSSRISKDDKKQEVDGINSGIRMNRSPLFLFCCHFTCSEKSGMEFSGYNRYKIDDFEDKPNFSVFIDPKF